MKINIFIIFLCASTLLLAQDSSKNDVFTTKGAQSISVSGILRTGINSQLFIGNISSRTSYEYFLLNGLSISGAVYNQSELVLAKQYRNVQTRFDPGLHTRYYFGLGKFLPYRCFFAEAGVRTYKEIISGPSGFFSKSNYSYNFGAGTQLKIKNNWFTEAYCGYERAYGLNARLGLTYRFAAKNKK